MIPEIAGDFLQQLRSFYYVATCGSVSDASNEINRTQSTVSYHIQLLEKSLNVVLFSRIKNKMILTDEGKHLLTWTLRIFDTISCMHDELCDASQYGFMRIAGTRPIFSSEEFGRSFSLFHERYPNIHVSLNSGHPSLLYSSITTGQNDFGLVGISSESEELDFIPLFRSPFLLAVSRSQTECFSSSITMDALKTLPYISFSINLREKTSNFSLVPRQVQEIMSYNSILSCSSYYIIMKYVAMGLGCTIIDMLSLKSLNVIDKIRVIDLSPLLPGLQYGIVLRKKSSVSKFKQDFINIIMDNMKNMNLAKDIHEFI